MTRNQEIGKHAARAAMICVQKRNEIRYSQDATLRWVGIRNDVRLPEVPKFADCSSLTTWLIHNSRLHVMGTAGPDTVNGQMWRAGYTGTQISHGKRHRFGTRFWQPGRTLVFYGRQGNITHVAMYVGKNSNGTPMVVSHGSDSGPLYLPWNYRGDYVQSRLYNV